MAIIVVRVTTRRGRARLITMAVLRGGEISHRHARTIIDHARSVPEEARPGFEQKLVESAKTLTVAKLGWKARLVRERLHPESITARYAKSVTDRRVSVEPASGGMAWLEAFLPAVVAYGIRNRLTQIVTSLKTADEPRTRTQLTADVFTDLLIDGTTEADDPATTDSGGAGGGHASKSGVDDLGRGVRATVMVTVPVLSLLGHSVEPATLEGYGPIDWATAKRLTAGAPSFTRILTHPETGVVLSVGRDRYKVPEDLRRWLRLRDGTCRFPGCNRAAKDCDIDHTIAWEHDGQTRWDNLAHLCKGAHALKHHTAWRVKQAAGGVLEWTAPSGHTYRTEPETRIGPAPPQCAPQSAKPQFTDHGISSQELPDEAPF